MGFNYPSLRMKVALLLCLLGLAAVSIAQEEDYHPHSTEDESALHGLSEGVNDDVSPHEDIEDDVHGASEGHDEDVHDETEDAHLEEHRDEDDHADITAAVESAAAPSDASRAIKPYPPKLNPEENKSLPQFVPFFPRKPTCSSCGLPHHHHGHHHHHRRFGCRCAIKKAFHLGFKKGHSSGYLKGFDDGKKKGELIGYGKGKTDGFNKGLEVGKAQGFAAGKEVGHKQGRREGIAEGKTIGIRIGVRKGWEAGKLKGLRIGYSKGFEDGLRKGSAGCACKLNKLKRKMIRRCQTHLNQHNNHGFHPHY